VPESDGKGRRKRRAEQRGEEGYLWSLRKRRGSRKRAFPDRAAAKPRGVKHHDRNYITFLSTTVLANELRMP